MRAHQPTALWSAALLVLLVGISGCSSSATKRSVPRPARSRVEFREIRSEVPFVTGHCKKASTFDSRAISDRANDHCYSLGPLLLTGAGISSAGVLRDPQLEQWVANLHWTNGAFARALANSNGANHDYAVTLDGVVQVAFVLNPSGVGLDHLLIASNYSRQEATAVAASITGVTPSQVPVEKWNSSDG